MMVTLRYYEHIYIYIVENIIVATIAGVEAAATTMRQQPIRNCEFICSSKFMFVCCDVVISDGTAAVADVCCVCVCVCVGRLLKDSCNIRELMLISNGEESEGRRKIR